MVVATQLAKHAEICIYIYMYMLAPPGTLYIYISHIQIHIYTHIYISLVNLIIFQVSSTGNVQPLKSPGQNSTVDFT